MATTVFFPVDVLPLPSFEGYAIEPLDAALRTEMEQGPARQRLLYTAVPERVTARWRFTQWQYAIFRSWYANKAKRGAEWFTITLLTGLGMVDHEARFVGRGQAPYHATPKRGGTDGVTWIVTSTLEVRESPDLDVGLLDILLTEDPAGLLAAIASFKSLVNAQQF